jgi:hypothetical protein
MPGRLRALATGAKLLYTAFVIATLIGLVVSWQLYGAAVGEGGPAAYYAGAKIEAPKAAAPPGGGPVIDLPDEVARPAAMTVQMPERKLLEVTHFHLFTIPVIVLILAHLWLLAKIPGWLQNTGVVLAVVTSGVHVAAPWLVRGSPGLAFLMPVSGAAMLLVLGAMALVATVDMWLPQPPMGDALAELRRRKAAREGSA